MASISNGRENPSQRASKSNRCPGGHFPGGCLNSIDVSMGTTRVHNNSSLYDVMVQLLKWQWHTILNEWRIIDTVMSELTKKDFWAIHATDRIQNSGRFDPWVFVSWQLEDPRVETSWILYSICCVNCSKILFRSLMTQQWASTISWVN